uniref:Reverse transcriptase domain-containing protein n=1 Tax=Fagus sylvatica TaxID=28930 RepID=A0A2N9GCP7_FAGSY
MSTLLTMKMEDSETLKDYSIRFWETYNDIEACGEEVAIQTFKAGLPVNSGLRQSLVKHPPRDLGKLMHKIDQFVRIEEDGRGTPPAQIMAQPKATVTKPVVRTGNTPKNLSAPKNFVAPTFRAFETVFKEPIYKVMEKIKKEPFFVWPPKMLGNPALKDGNLYCSYHREKGHMTENCHLLKVHLEKLASEGHLDRFINADLSVRKESRQEDRQPHSSGTPSAGIIHVIHNPICSAVSSASYRYQDSRCRRQPTSENPSPFRILFIWPQCIRLAEERRSRRILIDQGSFAEIMYQDLYEKLGLSEVDLSGFTTPIFGFSGEPVVPLGKTVLPVLAGPVNLQTEFIVVKASSPYNAIMGRDWLHRMKAVPSTLHQKLRFPTADGVMELNGDQSQELEDGEAIMSEQPEKVFFDPSNPEKFFLIGSKLPSTDREQLLQILVDNQDVFAWSVYDAPGVSPTLACHSLNIGPEHRPVVQKRRKLAPERAMIVLEEVERLLASGAIREIQYPAWLSNTVVVQKKNGKWRVCIDFTDLNKACPKDPFPLPRIDQLVDSAARHARLSFLDAFQGYHQIPMNPADQEKTAFITPRGTYCYRVMPFGLKNAGSTYQRMVTKMFGHMIGNTVEVYIDDMLVKSLREESHLADLLQVFNILRKNNLRLNASKCTFGVESGKFLGHVVSRKGIEANPDQVTALINLAEPRNLKQVQRLTGMIAALGRFISKPNSNMIRATHLCLSQSILSSIWAPRNGNYLLMGLPIPKVQASGIVLISPEGLTLEQAVRLKFTASNNEAEYEAMLIGLRTAKKLGADHLQIFCDSQLVANQISGEYQARMTEWRLI